MTANLIQGFQNIYRGALRPGEVFGTEPRPALRPVLIAFAVGAFVLALLLFITGMFSAQELQIASDRLNQYMVIRGSALSVFHVPSPPARFLFPLQWGGYLLFAAGVRHLTTVIFGESERSFMTMLLITVIAAAPLVLIAALQGVFNNLFPMIPPVKSLTLLWSRVILSVLVYLASVIWEAVVFVTAARIIFKQNYGRAIITWISPILFGLAVFYTILAFV